MNTDATKKHGKDSHLSHLNFLFTGRGSHLYNVAMVRLTRGLYRQVVEDMTPICHGEGKVLDAGTGPGTLARDIARRFSQFQVEGIDLSDDMIRLARQQTTREQLEERVHFTTGTVAHLPYPDHSFDLVVSTISMHHWSELEQPLRELYRVLQPGGRMWIYDFRFIQAQMVEKAKARTPFAETPLEHRLVRTGVLPFAFYQRFALHKQRHEETEPLAGSGRERSRS